MIGTLLLLLLIPALACTRTVNSPQQLTAVAERAAISRVTEAVIATELQRYITPTATFTVTPTPTKSAVSAPFSPGTHSSVSNRIGTSSIRME